MAEEYLIRIWKKQDPSKFQLAGPVLAEDFTDAMLVASTHIPSGIARIITTPQRLREQLGVPKLPWE